MKRQRQKREIHRFQRRAGFTDQHHLIPRSRAPNSQKKLMLDAYRHDAWHLLFGNKTLGEIIELLTEVKRRKKC